jgi:hypothetical protein
MPHEPQRGQVERPGRRHQKGTNRPGTHPHGATRTSTTTSRNRSAGYWSGRGVRFDTEVLAHARPAGLGQAVVGLSGAEE